MLIEKKYKLKGKVIQSGFNSKRMAETLGIDKSTYYKKLNNGSFTIKEVRQIICVLKLTHEEVMDIFFNLKVS